MSRITGWEQKDTCSFVSICIVDESLCFSITLMIFCVMLQVYLYFGHRQFGKRVLFIIVFHIETPCARLDVIFYGFHPQITSACKNYTSHVNRKSTD